MGCKKLTFITLLLALLALLAQLVTSQAVARSAPLDSWKSFRNQIVASSAGSYGVAVNQREGGVEFTYFARGAGLGPIEASETNKGSVEPRPGDRVLASTVFDQLPLEILVSETRLGYAAIEKYARLGSGRSISTFDSHGKLVASRTLDQLFIPEELRALERSVSSIWWYHAAWIDEQAEEVIVLERDGASRGARVFAASLVRDDVREAGSLALVRGLTHGGEVGACLAIERLAPLGRADLKPTYEGLLDLSHELRTRLHAGYALVLLGDRRAAALFLATVVPALGADSSSKSAAPEAERHFALEHLPLVAGPEALPRLHASLRGVKDSGDWWWAFQGIASFGEQAVPLLIEMLREEPESGGYRGGAAHMLKQLGSKRALDALLEHVDDPDAYVAQAALNAAIALDEEGVGDKLVALLRIDTTQRRRLALYFKNHRHPEASAALTKAIELEIRPQVRKALESAREHQR